jgi:hypothetical protein
MNLTKSKKSKISFTLAFVILIEAILPSHLLALTSGPTQPEFSSFQAINATEMVDLFTGDFKYNIPLLNVPGHQGGYPINLFYNSVTNVEDEASMVGLGWNLGVGNISRTVRGVPDDFNGEIIKRETYIKPQINVGAYFKPNVEIFGADLDKTFKGGFGQTFSMNYDNYNGLGFGLGLNLNLSNSKMSGSFGLNSNSFDGLSYSATISANFDTKKKDKEGITGSGGLGISGNAIDGITSISFNQKANDPDKKTNTNPQDIISISDRPTYISTGDLEFTGTNFNMSVKGGLELFGVTGNQVLGGFFTERHLKNRFHNNKSFGHMYAENGQNNNAAITDFNRINDKPIHSKTTHLPIGVPTEDIYTISGHGTGGAFTFKRDDTGVYKDKVSSSKTAGATIHVEAEGGNLFGIGGDFGANYSYNDNKAHTIQTNQTKFMPDMSNSTIEKGHFRKSDEITGDIFSPQDQQRAISLKRNTTYLGNDSYITPGINNSKFMKRATLQNNLLYRSNGSELQNADKIRTNRNPRQTVITRYLGKDILNSAEFITVPYLQVNIASVENPANFTYGLGSIRSNLASKTQIVAFEELNANGQRYIYGLPLKNIKKKDVSFALPHQVNMCASNVDIPLLGSGKINHTPNQPGSDDFLDITETPEFVHSYMLTSILGDNYIDTDPTDGLPSVKDRGYWVNFHYTKTSGISNYKYRVPFKGAQLNPGFHSIKADDKASYSYGEREQAYITAIETNSHIAKFFYSKREDGRGANLEYQNVDEFGAYSYKLDSIQLNTRNDIKEKTVIFKYKANGLCPGIPNSAMPEKGKLTLESVSIYNYNNTRGKLNPYVFEYFDANNEIRYGDHNFDRWGVYKTVNNNNLCKNYYEPYTDQINANQDVSAFHLKSITLPSGAKINIEVSRDHYAYVQDKAATEMVKITGVSTAGSNSINSVNASGRDVYFTAKPGSTINDYISNLYEDDNGKQIIFKIYTNMLEPNKNNYEYVTGAAYIDIGESSITNGTQGKIRLKPLDLPVKISGAFNQHPFLISNWQFLKVNLRKLLSPGVNVGPSNGVKSEAIKTFHKIAKLVDNVLDIFKGYYSKANTKQYGYKIDLDKSFIRLNSPEQKKYGGGIKVDKVVMTDIWDKEGVDIKYGNVYMYDTKVQRANGSYYYKSNGVAANEPFMGKEENSLYHIENIKDDLLFTTDILYYEMMPGNDMNLPSPSVGYSKVVVRSLPSNDMALLAAGQTSGLPSYLTDTSNPLNVSTTGEAVHEFHTAKDFPVVFEASNIIKSGFTPSWFPLLFVGFKNTNAYTATQSYICETNDMHGRPLRTTYYSQSKTGAISSDPVSYVEYQYNAKEELYDWGKRKMNRKRLVNDNIDLQVGYLQESNTKKKTYKGELGVDRSLSTDVRYVVGESSVVGLSPGLNALLAIIFPAVIPYAIPVIVNNTTTLETAVTNKHISKKGILTKIIAFDGQSKVETENLVFDPYTGSPVVTSVTDHFDQKKYNQNFPAYLGYDRMGPAYINAGMTFDFEGTVLRDPCTGFHALRYEGDLPSFANSLIPGDEFIVDRNDSSIGKTTAIFQKKSAACCSVGYNFLLFSFTDPDAIGADMPMPRQLKFTSIRSGNRNLFNNDGQSVTSLANTSGANITKVLSASANTYCDFWHYNEPIDGECSPVLPKCIDLELDSINHVSQLGTDLQISSPTLYANRIITNSLKNDRDKTLRTLLPSNVTRTFFKFNADPAIARVAAGDIIKSCNLSVHTNETIGNLELAQVFKIASNWAGSFNNLTWNSMPQASGSHLISFDHNTPLNTNFNVTLTNSIPDWENGFFIRLENETADDFAQSSLHGNEAPDASTHPKITVCFENGSPDPCNIPNPPIASVNDQFRSGAKGIFRMESQYNYRSNRNDNSSSTAAATKEKGIFTSSYTPFNWKDPLFFKSPIYDQNWLVSNKITNRNINGDVLETKNALNVYNNAIYVPLVSNPASYNHTPNVVHASTSNAQYHETACTSFEKYERYTIPDNGINWNNFDIAYTQTLSQEKYRILEYGANYIVIDKKYNAFNRYNNQRVEIYSGERLSTSQANCTPFSSFSTLVTNEYLNTTSPYSGMTRLVLDDVLDCDKIGLDAPDKAIINRTNLSLIQPANIFYDDNIAHTGKGSLKITSNTTILNKTLDLYKDKKYYASCWVYLNNGDLGTLANQGISLNINGTPLNFIGNRINGWQQIAGEFTPTTLPNGNLSIGITKGNHPEIFIDDFRIHPYEASMQSYVYDPGSYLLTYILDDNNFYTRYIYDSEGKLISIRKETERGVKSLQEQRSFIKPYNQ